MTLFLVFVFLLVSSVSAYYNSVNLDAVTFEFHNKAITDKCQQQMSQLREGLSDRQAWAWNMLDASPKLPYSILTGNALEFGNYDQCLTAQYKSADGLTDVKGKSCLAGLVTLIEVNITVDETTRRQHKFRELKQNAIRPLFDKKQILGRSGIQLEPQSENRTLALSVCIPDACNPSEVVEYLNSLVGTTIPFVGNDEGPCETEDDKQEFSNVDLAFVIFFGFIVIFNIASSLYDSYTARKGIEPHPLLLAFSFGRNFKILHENSNNPNRISCLDGLRVFSILWVILGHRFSISDVLPWVNDDYVDIWMNRAYTQYAQGAASAVDSFLFLTGLLTAMSFIKSQSRPKAKFNILLYYVHRYLRLTPAMGVVYFLHVSIFLHLGSGPLWSTFVYNLRDKCIDRWASFFFYYQNYLDSNGMCLLHTWYLSMDMQIFILSPLVLIPLVKFKKFMIKIGLPVLIILSMICAFVISYIYETQIFTQDYYDYYYYPMHTRLSAWLVGIYAGTLIYEYKGAKLNIHWTLNLFIWLCVVAGMIACVFPGNDVTYEYNRVNTAFYLAFHRPAWCAGLAWVVFACMKGRGGIFNWVLSIGIFQNLSKLTYSMYLVHISSLLLSVAKTRYPSDFNDFVLIHLFLGDILQVVTIALLWYVLFESPVAVLEKVLLLGGGKKKGPPRNRPAPQNGVEVKVES